MELFNRITEFTKFTTSVYQTLASAFRLDLKMKKLFVQQMANGRKRIKVILVDLTLNLARLFFNFSVISYHVNAQITPDRFEEIEQNDDQIRLTVQRGSLLKT